MTPTEKLLAEQEKIVAERGYYIRPVRMANLMKAASRIFDMTRKVKRSSPMSSRSSRKGASRRRAALKKSITGSLSAL